MALMQNITFSLNNIFVDLCLIYAMDMSHSTIRRAVWLSFAVAAVVEKSIGDEEMIADKLDDGAVCAWEHKR